MTSETVVRTMQSCSTARIHVIKNHTPPPDFQSLPTYVAQCGRRFTDTMVHSRTKAKNVTCLACLKAIGLTLDIAPDLVTYRPTVWERLLDA